MSMTDDDLQKYTVTQLRSHLKKRKLGTNGKKQELIARLLAADSKKNMKKSRLRKEIEGNATQRKPSTPQDVNGKVEEPSSQKKTASNDREMERREREKIVLWRHPVTTINYFVMEAGVLLYLLFLRLYSRKKTVFISLLVAAALMLLYHTEGSHQETVEWLRKNFLWCGYWVGLGILSSVGLGTGLHTFLLYLGPHIAAVTLAAYECQSVDFPEPPYPTQITCPEDEGNQYITMWTIISKVRLEAFMWGAGTALGELPPYFMARAARLSGADLDDDEFEEIEELIEEKKKHPNEMILGRRSIHRKRHRSNLLKLKESFLERAKISVHNLVQRVGFFGILLCASIPNPLFDLAGITCGHFLIPFWTFFGATLIGKAIIKMHIQKLFVIFLFSEHHVETVVHLIGKIPKYGPVLETPFKNYLSAQKGKLHNKAGTAAASETNILGWIFEKVIIVMVAYFLLSIINSMAQSYHKRCCKKKHLQNR